MTLRIIGDRPYKTFWGVAVTRFLLISIFFFALNSAALADHLPGDQPTDFQRGIAAYNAGDYHQTLDLIVPLALGGLPAAQTLLGDMYRFGEGVGKDYAAAEDWYKGAATQDYLPARARLEELGGVASQRTVMIRPGRKPASPVRSLRSAESEGGVTCELAFSDLRKYIALNDSRFPPASWRQRHCLPAPELRGAGMQEELLDVSTGSRLPLVKPPRPFRPSERAVAPPRDLAAPRAVAAPLESVEMETLEPVALLLDGGRPALFFAPPGPENKLRVALAAGDQVRVTVFGEDDLSGEFEIDAGGHLILPLIGRVAAAGASADQLGALIVTTLRQDGYMKQPRVSVEILNLRPIFVMGEVNNPGSYPYSTGLTALKAIALAGGFTYRAKKKVLFVTRDPEQGEQKLRVDNLVRPGDTIRVKERWF